MYLLMNVNGKIQRKTSKKGKLILAILEQLISSKANGLFSLMDKIAWDCDVILDINNS